MRWLTRTAILNPIRAVSFAARSTCVISSVVGGYTVYLTARIEMWVEEAFADEPVIRNRNDRR